jgi:hypothetical protein
MCLGLPENPRWLIGRKGDRATGPAVANSTLNAPQEVGATLLRWANGFTTPPGIRALPLSPFSQPPLPLRRM